MDDEAFLDSIYEAGAIPGKWEAVLHTLSASAGARAGMMLAETADGLHGYESGGLGEHRRAYIEEGWDKDTSRIDWLKAAPHPGFRTDLDFATTEQLGAIPVYRDFLTPRGIDAGAATLIPGLQGDRLLFSLEAFADHDAARAAVPRLDRLRPHLARAAMLSARLRLIQAEAAVEAFGIAGIAAALLTDRGTIRAANGRFETLLARPARSPASIRTIGPDPRLAAIFDRVRSGGRGGSVPLDAGRRPAILHVLPIRGEARDVFTGCVAIAVVAEQGRDETDIDLIRLLYDLTPTEAQVAALIGEGLTVQAIGVEGRMAVGTVRTHLKAIYSKLEVAGRTELALRLWKLRPRVGTELALPEDRN
jgi:DNA-binding CsgD family transcriptional regulator